MTGASVRRVRLRRTALLVARADGHDADRQDGAADWRRRHTALLHHLAYQGGRFRAFDSRLHAHTDQAVGVIDRLPLVAGGRRADLVSVAATVVALIEVRAPFDEQLDDLRAAFHRRAHECGAAIAVGGVRRDAEVQ